MEIQIAAEARGVTRKDIPCDTFRSIYLCNFKKAKALPNLTIKSVGKIGKGGWGEKEFGLSHLEEACPPCSTGN